MEAGGTAILFVGVVVDGRRSRAATSRGVVVGLVLRHCEDATCSRLHDRDCRSELEPVLASRCFLRYPILGIHLLAVIEGGVDVVAAALPVALALFRRGPKALQLWHEPLDVVTEEIADRGIDTAALRWAGNNR